MTNHVPRTRAPATTSASIATMIHVSKLNCNIRLFATGEAWKVYADKTIHVAMLQEIHANEGSDSVGVVKYAKEWALTGEFLAADDQVPWQSRRPGDKSHIYKTWNGSQEIPTERSRLKNIIGAHMLAYI